MADPITIELNGRSFQFKENKKCSSDQLKNIKDLAQFIFDNPVLLAALGEIFLYCYDTNTFSAQFKRRLILSEGLYEPKLFKVFAAKLEKFYLNSNEISNDRGSVQECLCRLALERKYKLLSDIELKFGCKISVKYDGNSFVTDPYDVDVCGKLNNIGGSYIESKRGIEGEKDEHAVKKMIALSKLANIYRDVNEKYKLDHLLFVFVLTNEIVNPHKILYYRSKWSDLSFIGINSFVHEFCQI